MNDVKNKKDIDYINCQLKNISGTINIINEDVKKVNNQLYNNHNKNVNQIKKSFYPIIVN